MYVLFFGWLAELVMITRKMRLIEGVFDSIFSLEI